MPKEFLQEAINRVKNEGEVQSDNPETLAINAQIRYEAAIAAGAGGRIENSEIAEELNKEFNTKFTEQDVKKIEAVVNAEIDGNIKHNELGKDEDLTLKKVDKVIENNEKMFEEKYDVKSFNKELLDQAIRIAERDTAESSNEVKAVNAAGEYSYLTSVAMVENMPSEKVAEILNEKFDTNLTPDDIQKIDDVAMAEQTLDVEAVGWDEINNNVDMNRINEIYENNKEFFEKINMQESEAKIEKNEINEEKEGFLDKAKEAISNKFEELQQAAQDVDLHSALRNSDNVFDQAQAEFFDQIDEFTQNLHNQKNNETTQDKDEEKYVEIPLKDNNQENEKNASSNNFKENENFNEEMTEKDNNKDLQQNSKNENNMQTENSMQQNNEGISPETQQKLEQKAEQAEKSQEQNQEKQETNVEQSAEKSAQKAEKEVEIEASH